MRPLWPRRPSGGRPLRWLYEDVSDASYRADPAGLARFVAELLPEVRNMHIEGSVDARVVGLSVREHLGRELFAGDGLPRAASEHHQDSQLERGEGKLASAEGCGVPGDVEGEITHVDSLGRADFREGP